MTDRNNIEVIVFSEEDARSLTGMGYRYLFKQNDITGKVVWYFMGTPEVHNFNRAKLPQSAVVKDCVCMNF